MKAITPEEVNQAYESMESFSDKDTKKFMRKFQNKQEALLVYLAALIEREELNDPEQDLLINIALLFWKLTSEASPGQKMITMQQIEEADTKMQQRLILMAESDEQELLQSGTQNVVELEAYGQPALVDVLMEEIMEAPEESGVRDEIKGILFLYLNSVLSLFLQAGS